MQSTSSPPQLSLQPNTLMTSVRGVFNPGNSHTKLAIAGRETIVSPLGLLFSPDTIDGAIYSIDGRSGDRSQSRQPWAMSNAGEKPVTVDGGIGKVEFCLPLFLGEAWNLMAENCEVELYVLCHDPQRMAAGIRANMQGVFNVSRDSEKKRIEIKVSGVAREGYGFKSMISTNGVDVLLDGGGGTVIATRHENGRVPAVGGVAVLDGFGSQGLVNFLMNNNYDGFLGNATHDSVRRYMLKGGKPCPEYARALDAYVAAMMNQIRRTPGIFTGADRVIWCGGMAKNKALTAALKRLGLPGFTVAANPQTADVDGVLLAKFGG